MRNCLFLTKQDARYGFDLTGFTQIVTDREQVLDKIEQFVRSTEPGLVIVDERLVDEESIGRVQALERRWGGAIVTLPAPARDAIDVHDDYGLSLIARVLGYQIKLR